MRKVKQSASFPRQSPLRPPCSGSLKIMLTTQRCGSCWRLTAAAYLFPRFPPLEVFRRRPQSMSHPRHRGRHSKTCTGTDMASTIFSSPAACDLADAVDEQLRHRARRREHVCGSISCFCIRDIKNNVDRKRRMEPAGTWRAVPLESDRAKPKMRGSICFAYTLLPFVQWKSVAHTR